MPETKILEDFLSREECARQLGVTVDTLTRWLTQRRGPASLMIGRRRFYRREAVLAWLQSQETGGARS